MSGTRLTTLLAPPLEVKISGRSFGVYCYALTIPDGWFTVASLMRIFTDKRDGLTTTVNELIAAGLVTAETRRDGNLIRTGYQVVRQ